MRPTFSVLSVAAWALWHSHVRRHDVNMDRYFIAQCLTCRKARKAVV